MRPLQPPPSEAVLAVTRRGMLGGETNCSPSCAPTVHLGRRAHSRRPCCGIVCRSAQRVKVRQPDSPLQHTDFGGSSSRSWPLWRCKLDGLCRFVLPVQRPTAWLHSKTTDAPRQGLTRRLATWLRTSSSIQEFGGECVQTGVREGFQGGLPGTPSGGSPGKLPGRLHGRLSGTAFRTHSRKASHITFRHIARTALLKIARPIFRMDFPETSRSASRRAATAATRTRLCSKFGSQLSRPRSCPTLLAQLPCSAQVLRRRSAA